MNKDHVENYKLVYPRMTAFKSWCNVKKQALMKTGTLWLQQREKSKQNKNIDRNENKTSNPYLEGIFKPVTECKQTEFDVVGLIPQQLNGTLLRIGPNPMKIENPDLYHWFSGDGMIHGLNIQSGNVNWFKSRFIATDSIQKQKNLVAKKGFRRGPGDVVNTNVFYHANKIWALIEAGTYPVALDKELNTESHQLLNSEADLPFTAHPHRDPLTGDLHAICYDALDTQHLYYEVFDHKGNLTHLTKIAVEHGPMVHDCAITEQDVIVFDFPVTFSKDLVLKGSPMPYTWNSQHGARVGVLPKYGQASEIVWLNIDPCFVFHAANAYREDDQMIVLDVVVHDRMFEQSKIGPYEQQKTQLERWKIDLKAKQVVRTVLDARVQEFPRIDERFTGLKNRYIYSVSYDAAQMDKPNQLLIQDLLTGLKAQYHYGDEWISGEVVFVPYSKDAEEGHGYLMSYVHNIDAKASKVVILNVQGLQIEVQAEIGLGVRVPMGFHVNWIELSNAHETM